MSLPAILFTSSRLTTFDVSLALGDESSCALLGEDVKTKSATTKYTNFVFVHMSNLINTVLTKGKHRADYVSRASCYYSCAERWRSTGGFIKNKKKKRQFLKNRKSAPIWHPAPYIREAEPGERVKFTVALFNQKTGHKFLTGSAEERMLWLHVEATDAKGNVYHLPVDKKGFAGEEYTIAANTLAYQDMGIALNDPNFKGIQRDGVPEGDRIFRLPYLDPQGRMTIQQWNTASLATDYRLGPRETKLETFTWTLPAAAAPGAMKVKAVLNYQKLPMTVAEFLGVPMEEAEIIEVNRHETTITVLP
jgi:hypothetical protein